ncbi:HD-GYP domain-containing protein [Candidatus Latescibacterota bacterium]
MRLNSVKDIQEGSILGKSIYLSDGTLLLGAGFRITKPIISKLKSRGYSHIYVMEEGTEEIIPEDVISDEIRHQAKSELAKKVSELENKLKLKNMSLEKSKQLLEDGYLEKFTISFDLRQIVKEILNDIFSTDTTYMSTLMLKSDDSYFLDHAINTTVLATLIGAKYRFPRKELANLALGTLLHDIGKIIIAQINDSSSNKSPGTFYKEHPTFGYLLLSKSHELTPMETQIINQHHEYQDGTGFPIGLKGRNFPPTKSNQNNGKGYIFRLAEITCVANAYDNLLMNPLQEEQLTPEEALKIILTNSMTLYNRDIVETLHKVIPIFPVGTRVKIDDIVDPSLMGCFGFVAKINESIMNRPVIIITTDKRGNRIKPIMLDTSKLNRIELKLFI